MVNKDNLPFLREELKHVNWNFLSSITDPEARFEAFFSTFREVFDGVFPLKISKPKPKTTSKSKETYSKDMSWYTRELAKIRSFLVLIHDHYKNAFDVLMMDKYHNMYEKVKKEYSSKVAEAKKLRNMNAIEIASNKCKVA